MSGPQQPVLDPDDAALLAAFETCALPVEQWHHREHIKLAYLFLLLYGPDQAMEKMRAGLQAYNASKEIPYELDRGYHETLTRAWLQLVHVTLALYGPGPSADEFLDKHHQLLSKRALLLFYSLDRIMSWDAKKEFVEPDLAPLPKLP